jgi:hypothetical protein
MLVHLINCLGYVITAFHRTFDADLVLFQMFLKK